MNKKILTGLLALCLLTGTMVGCGSKDNGGQSDTTTTAATEVTTTVGDTASETTAPAPDGLTVIAADGTTAFKVIRDEDANSFVIDAAVNLYTTLRDTYNAAKISISDDWVRKTDEDGTVTTEDYEILVGNTNRKETALAREKMGDNDYIICAINNKVVLLGKDTFSTKYAIEQFVAKYVTKAGEPLTVAADLLESGMGSTQGVALTEGAEMRIMTFNVLGSEEEPAKRYPHIIETILTYMPDIIGFQECKANQHDNVINKLKEDYTIAVRTHENSSTVNYTPILYLTEKYTQLDGGIEWLDSRYTGTNTKSISWVVLKSNETGKSFAVINLHGAVISTSYSGFETMPASERNTLVNEWRIDNVRQMLEIRDELKAKHGADLAVLFTGDFNFNDTSDPYKKVTEAGLTDAEVSATGEKMTGYKTTHDSGSAPGSGKSIDHIFYDPDEVTALRHYIAKKESYELNASDHCAVWADVVLK